jgi:NAD(P)H-hydrate epimerase
VAPFAINSRHSNKALDKTNFVVVRWIEDASELLTVSEMYRADTAAVADGVASLDLMEVAGTAIAETVDSSWPEGEVLVLCGPGNNGGDGFVAARLLADAGRLVRLALLGPIDKLDGDAAANAARWNGEVTPLKPSLLEGANVVIDALFGAGLGRPLEGVASETVEALNGSGVPCVAVDVPSGVHGDTGQVLGAAAQAATTVTFFRRKPGHLLYPGRGLCGEVRVADIGIPDTVLDDIAPSISGNLPDLWRDLLPCPRPESHKYTRGHAIIAGGAVLTGAARLASYAALRAGVGLATIAAPPGTGDVYRAGRPTTMVRDVADSEAFDAILAEPRVTAALIGPGNGVTAETADHVLRGLAAQPCVLDADALTVFADQPEALFTALSAATAGTSVLTPHEGEFARLFPADAGNGGKIKRTIAAAALSSAIVLLKGPDTVIASPNGRVAVNANAPAYLATAGSGDVLAGFIVGLMAQGLPAFEAACAGVWFHGACATAFGPGLVADDLGDMLPDVLRNILK